MDLTSLHLHFRQRTSCGTLCFVMEDEEGKYVASVYKRLDGTVRVSDHSAYLDKSGKRMATARAKQLAAREVWR
jgi:hypothetical protein